MPPFEPIEAFLVGRCGKSELEAALTTRREYDLLVRGHEQELQEKMEVARWIAFRIYCQNPYIRPPRAETVRSYLRFPWEAPAEDEVRNRAAGCAVSTDEAAELDRIFAELRKKKEIPENG